MAETELTRNNIIFQVKGLQMSLRYIRDALMFTFMDIPLGHFFELRGNLPKYEDERMNFLDDLISSVDISFFKDAEVFIVDSNDKELAEKFCKIDLLIWQLCILTSKYAEKHKVIEHIGEVIGELIQLVFNLKHDLLNEKFFDFNIYEVGEMASKLEQIAEERGMSICISDRFAGWSQLEAAVKESDAGKIPIPIAEKETELANLGRFKVRSTLNDDEIKSLYLFLGEYFVSSGPGSDSAVIDMKKISLQSFQKALWYACYAGFEETEHRDKLYFFISHFSSAYIENTKEYRKRAALSLGITLSRLEHYNKDDQFASKLQKLLPLIKYNNLRKV